ncbi:hypothetical protein ASC87_19940 [Rhizobacter sp. Root1221]|nr:hypothetical protein ASC87_19940 [Rhizobacter sp. Root1221]
MQALQAERIALTDFIVLAYRSDEFGEVRVSRGIGFSFSGRAASSGGIGGSSRTYTGCVVEQPCNVGRQAAATKIRNSQRQFQVTGAKVMGLILFGEFVVERFHDRAGHEVGVLLGLGNRGGLTLRCGPDLQGPPVRDEGRAVR